MAIGPDSKEANEAGEGCTDHDLSSLKVLARNCSFLRYFLNSHVFPVSDDSKDIRAPTGDGSNGYDVSDELCRAGDGNCGDPTGSTNSYATCKLRQKIIQNAIPYQVSTFQGFQNATDCPFVYRTLLEFCREVIFGS